MAPWRCTWIKPAALLTVLALLAGCAGTLPPVGAERPLQLASDEKEIWQMASREQDKLAKSGSLYQDRLLEEYLNGLARRLAPPEMVEAVPITVRVIQNPTLNAFAYPNGAIYLHTGILARLENEAQLAAVLGHEIGHVSHRHAVRHFRQARTAQFVGIGALIAAQIGLAALGASQGRGPGSAAAIQAAAIFTQLGLQLGLLASVNGYGRGLETEADHLGLEYLVKAGYDPKQAPRVFDLLLKEYGDRSEIETFFFGNHPTNQRRMRDLEAQIAGHYAAQAASSGRRVNSEDYQRRMRVLVRENALLDIRANRYNTALAALARALRLQPNDPIAHYYMGEAYRQRGQAGDLPRAIEAYKQALRYRADYPEPHRELGLAYYKLGDKVLASVELKRYLELSPKAKDEKEIREYLLELGAS
ncbi:MAG: M48 family metalloprotease [Deltaproteobacteria bacterium]|nr:M48 family metalloprotease [Deltaproteobacteria bacterium]